MLKNFLKKLIIIAVLGVFAIYIFSHFGRKPEKWTTLSLRTVSIPSKHKSLIMTDDLLYRTRVTGELRTTVKEGTRLKKGQLIGIYVASSSPSELEAKSIDEELEKVEDKKDKKSSKLENYRKKMSSKISNAKSESEILIKKLEENLKKGDVYKSKEVKKQLIYNLDLIEKINENEKNFIGEFNEKEKVIGSLDTKIGDNLSLFSSRVGTVSYKIDKYLGEFEYKDRYSINLEEILASDFEAVESLKELYSEGDIVFRIISSNNWHILSLCSLEELDNFKVDSEVSIKIGKEELSARIVEKFKNENKGMLVFQVQGGSDNLRIKRRVNLNVMRKEKTGIEIPKNAIFEKDGKKGCYVKALNSEKVFRPISIIEENSTNFIVKSDSFTIRTKEGVLKTVDTVTAGDDVLIDDETE